MTYVPQPVMYRGTTKQVCGLYPFSVGSNAPMVGVPMGRHLSGTGGTVGFDPISWFEHTNLIGNPSMIVLALPNLGKSTFVRTMCTGLAAFGVTPMVLGDLKPDYVDLIAGQPDENGVRHSDPANSLGGQVIELGPGVGAINILDPGQAAAVAAQLAGKARTRVLAEAHERRKAAVSAAIIIQRGGPPIEVELNVIDRALRLLDERHHGVPVLKDLHRIIDDAPQELAQAAASGGKVEKYEDATWALKSSLIGLMGGGPLGDMLARPTTAQPDLDRPLVYNISSIPETNKEQVAAALMAAWSHGAACVNYANELADAGKAPQRRFFLVFDELWRALGAGGGMVDRVNELTRLNRAKGVGQALISHSMADFAALDDEADRRKALGFVERSGAKIFGGLPDGEMDFLNDAVRLTQEERDMLVRWGGGGTYDSRTQTQGSRPGMGKFLIKMSHEPGIPMEVHMTDLEAAVNDTNQRWNK